MERVESSSSVSLYDCTSFTFGEKLVHTDKRRHVVAGIVLVLDGVAATEATSVAEAAV